MERVNRTNRKDLQRSNIVDMVGLWNEVWPDAGGEDLEEKVEDAWRRHQEAIKSEVSGFETFHRIWVEGQLAATSRSFIREIEYVDTGERIRVLALASVCSRPGFRKLGLGRRVVMDAFRRLEEEGLSLSLFQTTVPDFYRKLGGRTIENRFFNSLGEIPEATPWWNDYAVIYPGNAVWREAPVDLRGAGY